jgi:hypothetical protein
LRAHDIAADVNAFWENQSFHNYADYAMGAAAIQVLEPNGSEPIAELRERVQALKAIKMLEPSGSDSIGEVRDRVQPLNV